MPSNKNKFLRVYLIDRCLRSGKNCTLDELTDYISNYFMEHFGQTVSRSSIKGDIKFMRDEPFSAPIAHQKGSGYFYEDKSYSFFGLGLTDDQVEVLEAAVQVLDRLGLEIIGDILENIVRRTGFFDGRFPEVLVDANEGYKGFRWLSILLKAIVNRCYVHISYRSFIPENDYEGEVRPVLLKEYNNRWFLIGLPEKLEPETADFAIFPLDRIEGVKVLEKKTFYLPEDQHAKIVRSFREVVGVTVINENPLTEIVFEVRHPRAKYVITKPFHPTQKILENNEQLVRFSVKVRENNELYAEFLYYLPDIRIVSPLEIREKLRRRLEESLRFMG